jgi:multidrug efflux pump subunit AcrA (membrane-fusion protein)
VSNRKAEAAERQARLAAIQAAQRKSERRRTTIIASIVGVVVLALVAVTLFVVSQQNAENEALEEQAAADIEGVETFEGLSANHVQGTVEYEQTPPVGGDHNAVWQNCGVYPSQPANENAVHSLEHGAVWITYDPDLPADQVELLEAQAASNNYVLVTPYEGLPTPVVASAWGLQLQLDDASDDRLPTFVRKYVRGDQTPEPGAPCTGGTGTPE